MTDIAYSVGHRGFRYGMLMGPPRLRAHLVEAFGSGDVGQPLCGFKMPRAWVNSNVPWGRHVCRRCWYRLTVKERAT